MATLAEIVQLERETYEAWRTIVTCPECCGDGGGAFLDTSVYPDQYGHPQEHWIPCLHCDGQGEIQIVPDLEAFFSPEEPRP